MNEMAFSYESNNITKYTGSFKYDYEELIDLLFSYQRIIRKLNSTTFNEPVAAIKVAAGSLCMHNIVLSKKGFDTNKDRIDSPVKRKSKLDAAKNINISVMRNGISNAAYHYKDIFLSKENFLYAFDTNFHGSKYTTLLNWFKQIIADTDSIRNIEIEHDRLLEKNEKIGNIYENNMLWKNLDYSSDLYKFVTAYNSAIDKKLNIYRFEHGKKHMFKANMYPQIIVSKDILKANSVNDAFTKNTNEYLTDVIKQILTSDGRRRLNEFYQTIARKDSKPGLTLIEQVYALKNRTIINWIDQLFANRKLSKISIIEQTYASEFRQSINLYENLNANGDNNFIINIYNDTSIPVYKWWRESIIRDMFIEYRKMSVFIMLGKTVWAYKDRNIAWIPKQLHAHDAGKIISIDNFVPHSMRNRKDILLNNVFSLFSDGKSISIFNFILLRGNDKVINLIQEYWLKGEYKNTDINKMEELRLFAKYAVSSIMIKMSGLGKAGELNTVLERFQKHRKESFLIDQIWMARFKTEKLYTSIFKDGLWMFRKNPFGFIEKQSFGQKDFKEAFLSYGLFLYKNTKEGMKFYEDLYIWRKNKLGFYQYKPDFIQKKEYELSIPAKEIFLYKKYRAAFLKQISVSTYRKWKYTQTDNGSVGLKMYGKPAAAEYNMAPGLIKYREAFIDYGKTDLYTHRNAYIGWTAYSEPTAWIRYRDTMAFNSGLDIYRESYKLNLNDLAMSIMRKVRDISFFYDDGMRYLLIPVKKEKKAMGFDIIDEWLRKEKKEFNFIIQSEDFASKLPKDVSDLLDKQFIHDSDKVKHDLNIYHTNYWAIKSRVAIMIQEEILFLQKNDKEISMYPQAFSALKIRKSMSFDEYDLHALKLRKKIFMAENTWLAKGKVKAFTDFKEFWTTKDGHGIFFTDATWIDTESRNIGVFTDEWVINKKKGLGIYELIASGDADKKEMNFYTAMVSGSKIKQTMSLFHDLYDGTMPKRPTRISDQTDVWAWSYEPPDPFESGVYGIDELLLPEEDTRYKDFEGLIFNKQTMRPRNPVKRIDENTWVARFPVKHPLPERKDVGNLYTGIVVDQYFGVRSTIMHKIYLEFYTLWQAHIFEFAAMTMIQSLKTMLAWLFDWIETSFDDADKPEAYRVYHQIRWFGECAVLNNSQYIISYDTQDIVTDLSTGICNIPNDLDTQNTMFVDNSPGMNVIRNNPALIGISECHVEFYIKGLRKNSAISFDLNNSHGSVNIIIDGTIVDTVSGSKMNVTYPINYTGSDITIRIEKTKPNNVNNDFFIGHITIKDMGFKDLSIDFDPTVRQGNKPMDEMAKKMIQYANMHDDLNVAYQKIREGNLGVSVTMDQMLYYWEHHHQDKIKGKRLTIKKT